MIILRNDWDFIDPQLLIYFDELLWSVLNDARLESLEAIWANRSRPRMSQHSQVAHSASVSLRYSWFLWFFPWVFRLCFHVCLLKFRPPFFSKKNQTLTAFRILSLILDLENWASVECRGRILRKSNQLLLLRHSRHAGSAVYQRNEISGKTR